MSTGKNFEYNKEMAAQGARVYWNAGKALKDVWLDVYGDELHITAAGRQGYLTLLEVIEDKLKEQKSPVKFISRLKEIGFDFSDPETPDKLIEVLRNPATFKTEIKDIDDITPNEFKSIIFDIVYENLKEGTQKNIPLNVFLRQCLDRLWEQKKLTRRINVGKNRHFYRMFQWLSEAAEDTSWWDDGEHLKIMNSGLRGKVRSNPESPEGLIVRMNG